jgi:hypothetical protein
MESDKKQRRLYSAGDCPVCADSGAVLLLKAQGSGRLFVFCPLCGVAWPEPPIARRLDTIFALTRFAPAGVVLPTVEEAMSIGFSLKEEPFERWDRFLEDLLA